MKNRNMRRACIIIVAVVTMLLCAGCSFGELEYDMNLGYDLNKVKSKDITFNVYHVNPEDHSWERIASFPCTPEPGHYNDVKIEGEKGKIKAVLSDNTYTESDDGNSGRRMTELQYLHLNMMLTGSRVIFLDGNRLL